MSSVVVSNDNVITSQPLAVKVVNVDVPTYITGIMEFDSGVVGNLFTTFDVVYDEQAHFESTVRKNAHRSRPQLLWQQHLHRPESGECREMPLVFDYKENSGD